jgi:predicted nucleic acid-binding Zn ribbon protein
MSAEELACASWSSAVGKRIASHTRATRLVRTRLVIEVEDAIWQRQLFALTPHILKNLERSLGSGLVDDLEFRVIPRRREPQRAMAVTAGTSLDEADAIADPILRGIYRASRKKALA